MRAAELATDYPTVTLDSDALDAARMLAAQKLPGVLVVDADGAPYAVLPASELVKLLVPAYVLEDSALAAVVDEHHADRLCQALAGRSVAEALPREPRERTRASVADADDTALEVAALMAREHSPLVAVVDSHDSDRLLGVITASHLLDRLIEVT
jgi:CBS domain-containing protein